MQLVRTYIVCRACQARLRAQIAISSSQPLTVPVLVCPKCGNRGELDDAFQMGPQQLHDRLREELAGMLEIEVELETLQDTDSVTVMDALAVRGKQRMRQRQDEPKTVRTRETDTV